MAVTVPVGPLFGCLVRLDGGGPRRGTRSTGNRECGRTHTPRGLRTMIQPQCLHLVAVVMCVFLCLRDADDDRHHKDTDASAIIAAPKPLSRGWRRRRRSGCLRCRPTPRSQGRWDSPRTRAWRRAPPAARSRTTARQAAVDHEIEMDTRPLLDRGDRPLQGDPRADAIGRDQDREVVVGIREPHDLVAEHVGPEVRRHDRHRRHRTRSSRGGARRESFAQLPDCRDGPHR